MVNMARILTDTYFVKYSMVVAGIRTNGVEKDVERNGSGVFVISEYSVSVTSEIHKILELELKGEYPYYDIPPYIKSLTIIDIRPL